MVFLILFFASGFIGSGDNFFKSTSYTIEAICAQAFKDAKERLKGVEAEMLRKRNSLHEFEAEYKQVQIFRLVILLRLTLLV